MNLRHPPTNDRAPIRQPSLRVSLWRLFASFYPDYVIRPFRAQGVRELAAALLVLRFRPIVMGACLLFAIVAAIRHWQVQPGRWRRIGMVAGSY